MCTSGCGSLSRLFLGVSFAYEIVMAFLLRPIRRNVSLSRSRSGRNFLRSILRSRLSLRMSVVSAWPGLLKLLWWKNALNISHRFFQSSRCICSLSCSCIASVGCRLAPDAADALSRRFFQPSRSRSAPDPLKWNVLICIRVFL